MAVKPLVPNHDDSPWYKIMEDKGKVWEEIAGEVGAEITGLYNAYMVEFEMTQNIGKGILKINGKRELTNLNSSGIFSEVLKVTLQTKKFEEDSFLKIGSREMVNLFFKLTDKYRYKSISREYKIRYNSEPMLDKILHTNILNAAEVIRMTVYKEGLDLEVAEIPADKELARKVRDVWKVML